MPPAHTFRLRLPPLHSLQVFATAAQAGSFSQAAGELFVTQSAVSRQIQQLEEDLGCMLFIRRARGLALTPEGAALLPAVEEALHGLSRACDALREAGTRLTLRLPPTLAIRWFLPRLPRLQARLPDVEVRITSYSPDESDLLRDVDAAIDYGQASNWPDLDVVPLMPEVLIPTCTPALLPKLRTPADLANVPLLHCTDKEDWKRWLLEAGAPEVNARRGQVFDTLDLAMSAAIRGQGVAIGDLTLLQESLDDGVLVTPFDLRIESGNAYYLVYPPQRGQQVKIKALRAWLIEECGS